MTKTYNVDIVGNLTNTKGVLSGFSSSNYATFKPLTIGAKNTEIVFQFNCTDVIADSMIYHFGDYTKSYGCVSLEIYQGKFYLWFGKSGGGVFDINGSTTLQNNTDYWVKTFFDRGNNKWELYLSTDGENYLPEGTAQNTNYIASTNNTLSTISSSNYPFQGTINLNGCYIYADNQYFWQGATGEDDPEPEHTDNSPLQFIKNLVIGDTEWKLSPFSFNNMLKIDGINELPSDYKRLLGYTCDNNVLWQITGFKLRGSDTVRVSFSVTAACNVFGCYQGAAATDNYDLYASVTSGSKYFRYGSGTYLSYFSPSNLGQRFDVVYTPTGSNGMPQDSTWSPMTFESANDLLIGSTTLTGTSSKLKGNLYGNFEVDNRLKLIPCERLSDNSLGYYDTYSGTFFEPTGTPTSLGYA